MAEPMISYHRLVSENNKDAFKQINKLNFGTIAGAGYSNEIEFFIWNNYNGNKDVPNLQLGKISIQLAESTPDVADIEPAAQDSWLSIREADNPEWTILSGDGEQELILSRTLTGYWNEGEYLNPEYSDNYIRMIAKLTVPINATAAPYTFDIKITGKYV